MEKERIRFYEEAFKQFVMSSMVNQNESTLKQYLIKLVEQNASEYRWINYAFLNVKKELIG